MVLDDLRDKASKYGQPYKPFVIAVLYMRDLAIDHFIEEALYGPHVVTLPVSDDPEFVGEAQLDRDPYGLWQRGQSQRATRVSAVLSAVHLTPWSIASTPLRLWLNPWAKRPLSVRLPWATISGDLHANTLVRHDATRQPHEILGLDDGWPAKRHVEHQR